MEERSLAGPISPQAARAFSLRLTSIAGPVRIDLGDADLEDAVATSILIDAIRAHARAGHRVVVLEPPQVLAHGLYRVGALASSKIEIRDPREELGTSS